MENKPLRFHPAAEQEYLAALAWYRERSELAASDFANAIRQATEKISEAPQSWPLYFSEFRKYTLRQFPFAVVYRGSVAGVVVFAIAHARRRPGYWASRL